VSRGQTDRRTNGQRNKSNISFNLKKDFADLCVIARAVNGIELFDDMMLVRLSVDHQTNLVKLKLCLESH